MLLHYYYTLHLLLFRNITNSLLSIMTSLLHYYDIITTLLLQTGNHVIMIPRLRVKRNLPLLQYYYVIITSLLHRVLLLHIITCFSLPNLQTDNLLIFSGQLLIHFSKIEASLISEVTDAYWQLLDFMICISMCCDFYCGLYWYLLAWYILVCIVYTLANACFYKALQSRINSISGSRKPSQT